jgi:hypothetical protein
MSYVSGGVNVTGSKNLIANNYIAYARVNEAGYETAISLYVSASSNSDADNNVVTNNIIIGEWPIGIGIGGKITDAVVTGNAIASDVIKPFQNSTSSPLQAYAGEPVLMWSGSASSGTLTVTSGISLYSGTRYLISYSSANEFPMQGTRIGDTIWFSGIVGSSSTHTTRFAKLAITSATTATITTYNAIHNISGNHGASSATSFQELYLIG